MTVRAKFRVTKIELSMGYKAIVDNGKTTHIPTELTTIIMHPVFGNGDPTHENTKFWQASPSGELKLGTVNREAAAQFALDAEYYVDFSPA